HPPLSTSNTVAFVEIAFVEWPGSVSDAKVLDTAAPRHSQIFQPPLQPPYIVKPQSIYEHLEQAARASTSSDNAVGDSSSPRSEFSLKL
ncbi:MAG: hypothetical protein AAFU53_05505, partial [Cyanobacteria bacterium J06632_3]